MPCQAPSPCSPQPPLEISAATARDVPLILSFIRDLADYERLSHEVVATEASLERWLFGEQRAAEVVIAREDGEPVGFALYFVSFSTFLGRPGIYLEDLYVRPDHRRRGHGKALLCHLAALTQARGFGRLEWSVLDDNAPALAFYRRLGARRMTEWTVHRVTGEALEALARDAVDTGDDC